MNWSKKRAGGGCCSSHDAITGRVFRGNRHKQKGGPVVPKGPPKSAPQTWGSGSSGSRKQGACDIGKERCKYGDLKGRKRSKQVR